MLPTPRLLTSATEGVAPMTNGLPTPEELRKVLKYIPETGKLFWKEREATMFSDGHRDAIGNCNNWNARYAYKEAFTSFSKGYLIGSVFGRKFKSHRVAWAIHYGEWPMHQIDHVNGDRGDNRIENLRDVNNKENHRNMKTFSSNTSGHVGVYPHDERFRVRVGNVHVGIFNSFDEAVLARKEAQFVLGFHLNHGR